MSVVQTMIYAVVFAALLFGCYQLYRRCKESNDDTTDDSRMEFFERGLQAAYYEASRMQQQLDKIQGCDSKFTRAQSIQLIDSVYENGNGHVGLKDDEAYNYSKSMSQLDPASFAEGNII